METRDPKLGSDFEMQELELVLKLGLLCSHPVAAARPSMSQVVLFLDGDLPVPELSKHELDDKVSATKLSTLSSFIESKVLEEQESLLHEDEHVYYAQ